MSQEPRFVNLIIGIICTIIASILFSYGLALQKKAVMEMPEIKLNEVNSMTALVKNKTWVWGVIIPLIGGIPFVIAQALIGVALTQPLMLGLQLAFLVLFATYMLDEKLEKIEIIGFLILITAPIFLVLGNVTPPAADTSSSEFFINFILFVIPAIIICVILFLLVKKVENSF